MTTYSNRKAFPSDGLVGKDAATGCSPESRSLLPQVSVLPFKPLLEAPFVKLVPTFQHTHVFWLEHLVAYLTGI